ncbi:hypothetical protein DXG01_010067 [Tephrocybe rancida]|nr:hypothetical protein DXG01_010067 [Tephrocybe rancida]
MLVTEEPHRIVCTGCDEMHQTPPPPEKMFTLSRAQLDSLHATHIMLWIRDDRAVEIPDDNQLTRVEGRLTAMERIVEERLNKIDERMSSLSTAENSQMVDTKLGSVEGRIERRISALEARFDSVEALLREFVTSSRVS